MADRFRIVTFPHPAKRPTVLLDLEDGVTYRGQRSTLKITPPGRKPAQVAYDRRYAGARTVGESHDNGAIARTIRCAAATADLALAAVNAIVDTTDEMWPQKYVEWRPDGATRSTYFELRGPVVWQPNYEWAQFSQGRSLEVEVTFTVAPLALGDPFDIWDDFAANSIADYTADAGSVADLLVTGGALTATANLTVEKALLHGERGYSVGDSQETVKFTPGATITSFQASVRLKRTAANQYVKVYVDDNGTNSRLRIDKLVAGTPTNLATTNLAARVTNGTAGWVRGRIEGNVIVAEYFTAEPTPMGTPTLTNTYTLAGGEIAQFGAGVAGGRGIGWIPQHASATLDDYRSEPYTRRNVTLPEQIQLLGAIPGTAPALADVTITPSGGAAVPIWALIGWSSRPGAPLSTSVAPFGILEAETAGDLSGWAVQATASGRGGSRLRWALSGAGTATASWLIDPSVLQLDDFHRDQADVEVWARVATDAGAVSPKMTLSLRPEDGLSFGDERFTHEWGSTGKLLVKPSSASQYRFVRLGTVPLPVDASQPRRWKLWLAGSVAAASSGESVVDYLVLVPVRQRALSPTAKANDASFPKFVASTSQTSKRINADLSGLIGVPPANLHPAHGLGGAPVEVPTGSTDMVVKLSSLVPDDPTVDATSEQLAYPATVHVAVRPRFHLARG